MYTEHQFHSETANRPYVGSRKTFKTFQFMRLSRGMLFEQNSRNFTFTFSFFNHISKDECDVRHNEYALGLI